MNLYRLDYIAADGLPDAPVQIMGRDFLTSTRARADAVGIEAAKQEGCAVAVTRISGGGRLRRVALIDAEGKRHPCKDER